MRFSIGILICSAIVHHLNLADGQPMDETEKRSLFDSFVKQFKKNYRDEDEFNFRFQVFKNTLDRISELNDQRRTSTDAIFGLTSYSDLTPDEFKVKVINEKVNRRQASVKANNSNNSPNKSSSSDSSSVSTSSGSLSSAPDSRRIEPTNLSSSGSTTNSLGSLTIRNGEPQSNMQSNRQSKMRSELSALDKLIEKHLSLHAQLGGHLDTSKIDLDLLVNSFASNQFKQIDSASNPAVLELALADKLKPELKSELKSEPKTELKPESKYKFRFQFFKELDTRWNSEMEAQEPNATLQELTLAHHTANQRPNRFERTIQSNRRAKRSTGQFYFNAYDEALPASFPRQKDWRESNAISAIDNQGVCGACWAHSTLETIESMAAIKYSWPINKRLSVQQLIDCSSNNYGCLGGDTCAVLAWISANRIKIASAKAYPTRANAGECLIQNDQLASGFTVHSNFTCTNFTNNEIELIKILATHGPVATTADATLWQDYLGGIIQFNCGREANHAVQIVGYNLETETPYYIVRNTWSSSFGLDGYLHVAIGGNLCALEERVSALDVEMI